MQRECWHSNAKWEVNVKPSKIVLMRCWHRHERALAQNHGLCQSLFYAIYVMQLLSFDISQIPLKHNETMLCYEEISMRCNVLLFV